MKFQRKLNNILKENGDVLSVDVSSKRHPSAVMLINRSDFNKVQSELKCGRLFAWGHGDLPQSVRCRMPCGKVVYVHRLILEAGEGMVIDHINQNPLDNRALNLRAVKQRANAMNCKLSSNNKHGTMGIHPTKNRRTGEPNGRWSAEIKVNRKKIYLGCFGSKQAAIDARKAAERKYGFHPNHGQTT